MVEVSLQLGLTVIALITSGRSPVLCYAQLRRIRWTDRFPPPSLPEKAKRLQLVRLAPGRFGTMLVCWEQAVEGDDVEFILAELKAGRLTVPSNAPEFGGLSISGLVSHDTWVIEGVDRSPIDGTGVLRSTALIIPGGALEVVEALQAGFCKAEVARELQALIETIDDYIGLSHGFFRRGRLGAVEYLWRASGPGSCAPIKITVIKPNVRSSDPCRTVVLTRVEDALRSRLRIQLRTFARDEIIFDRLVQLDAEQNELHVDVGRHLTDISARIYDDATGELVDEFELPFIQSIDVDLNLHKAVDLLPPPFRSAPTAVDLTERARTTRSKVEIRGGELRDPPASAIRANTEALEILLGSKTWHAKSRFFRSGSEPQVDVIRWIKEQFERGDVAESFLIDPYLGSQALERVIIRHG